MKIGITGVTGFVGSAIACQLLKSGHSILAVSRNDKSGERSISSIKDAWLGFEYSEQDFDESLIEVISIDFENLETIPLSLISNLDAFWHVASDMAYSSRRFIRSFQQNVTNTAALHRFLADNAKQMQRFYYVSTAYTGGFGSEDLIKESLHIAPKVDNIYQALKWTAELTLTTQSKAYDLPVSVYRPSIVVGHSKNGYRANSEFGLYGFIKAAYIAAKNKSKAVRFNVNKNAELNIIPIDYLANWACQLTDRPASKEVEIFNAVSSVSPTNEEICRVIQKHVGIETYISEPKNSTDRLINKMTSLNAPFAQRSWIFEAENLKEALGEEFEEFQISDDSLDTIISRYVFDLEEESANAKKTSSLKSALNKGKQTLNLMGVNIQSYDNTSLTIKIDPSKTKNLILDGFNNNFKN